MRQLDRLAETALTRTWQAGARPGDRTLVVDADSTICQVYGHYKQGRATYGSMRQPGYHPLLATRADTGEVLHADSALARPIPPAGAPVRERDHRRIRRAGVTAPIVFRGSGPTRVLGCQDDRAAARP
jgi:hypothetical protein